MMTDVLMSSVPNPRKEKRNFQAMKMWCQDKNPRLLHALPTQPLLASLEIAVAASTNASTTFLFLLKTLPRALCATKEN